MGVLAYRSCAAYSEIQRASSRSAARTVGSAAGPSPGTMGWRRPASAARLRPAWGIRGTTSSRATRPPARAGAADARPWRDRRRIMLPFMVLPSSSDVEPLMRPEGWELWHRTSAPALLYDPTL